PASGSRTSAGAVFRAFKPRRRWLYWMSWRATCFNRDFACFASESAQNCCAAVVRSIAFPSGWSSFRRRAPSAGAAAVAWRSACRRQRIDAKVGPVGTLPQGMTTSVVVVAWAVLVVELVEVDELEVDVLLDVVGTTGVVLVVELVVEDVVVVVE